MIDELIKDWNDQANALGSEAAELGWGSTGWNYKIGMQVGLRRAADALQEAVKDLKPSLEVDTVTQESINAIMWRLAELEKRVFDVPEPPKETHHQTYHEKVVELEGWCERLNWSYYMAPNGNVELDWGTGSTRYMSINGALADLRLKARSMNNDY